MFTREQQINNLKEKKSWDFIIIGGGSTGLGVALDAATRGFSTLLLEQADFAKGTSSRSTKLVHGGVRYLEQGNIQLVFSALKERGILLKNAPHLVNKQSFIIPCYSIAEIFKYVIGLKLYDWLSGKLSFGSSSFISKRKTKNYLPNISEAGLKGGVEYFDGQFDDARLAVNLVQTAIEKGATVINYFKVTGLQINKTGEVEGLNAVDLISNYDVELKSKMIINATGVFVDSILKMASPNISKTIKPSQGIHLVFKSSILNSTHALLIPKTSDGRVLFAIPWHNHTLVGTTDTPVNDLKLEPVPLKEEIDFILQTMTKYFNYSPKKEDILSTFAGLRPLVITPKKIKSTKELSRDHKIMLEPMGLLTITGGKWTTYRKMAQDVIDFALSKTSLKKIASITKTLPIHGHSLTNYSVYGSDEKYLELLIKRRPILAKKLIENLPYTEAQVVWAIKNEMAQTIEDVLARRLRILFLDAKAAKQIAPRVADIFIEEKNMSDKWKEEQLKSFNNLADHYLLH